jgi:hypothetical protein
MFTNVKNDDPENTAGIAFICGGASHLEDDNN